MARRRANWVTIPKAPGSTKIGGVGPLADIPMNTITHRGNDAEVNGAAELRFSSREIYCTRLLPLYLLDGTAPRRLWRISSTRHILSGGKVAMTVGTVSQWFFG